MRLIKKLDVFILRKFALVFAGAFFICLFVFMMQFTWRYVEDLIGKGLSMDVLARFFSYMAVSLVPSAMPLAVLLAALITFGNMGEQLELTAMKSSGIPLVRILRPVALVALLLTGVAFWFQNTWSPMAQMKLRTLLFSMRQTSPALEIPEGVFYNGITNVNLYVERKEAETGMLYNVTIYKTNQGFDKAQILLADSGRLLVTADKLNLLLDLWNGTQFQNLQAENFETLQHDDKTPPYDRETFAFKRFLIDFDSNFEMMDEDMVRSMAAAKSMRKITADIDSASVGLDSIGRGYLIALRKSYLKVPSLSADDSLRVEQIIAAEPALTDTLLADLTPEARAKALRSASSTVRQYRTELNWKKDITTNEESYIRRHRVEWNQKITISLSCLFFFFIGAPLGAIIRKGGLGMPTVISVLIFIVYYIINTSGMKLARDGSWNMAIGMWISTIVLTPFGIFFTFKANNDSTVFNADAYIAALRSLLGLPAKRHIYRKEVIIEDPDYAALAPRLEALGEGAAAYLEAHSLLKAPSYIRTFFRYEEDRTVATLSREMENIVEQLSNSRDAKTLAELNRFPVISPTAHTSPFHTRKWNIAAGLVFPVGLVLLFRIWRFRLRLYRDLKQIQKSCEALSGFIRNL